MTGLTFTQAAALAQMSYDGEYGISDYTAFAEAPTRIKKEHTELYVFKLKNGKTVLSFQGSNGYLDWIDDLNCLMVGRRVSHETEKGVKISKGFDSNYKPISQTVVDLIESIGISNVIFIGHSLGAANAIRARFEVKRKCGVSIPTIVFGEPHGGNKAYYDIVGTDSLWSIQNGNDIVCHVPFCSFGYHSPQRIRVDGSNIDVPHIEISWLFKRFGSCDDHYPQRYVEGCKIYEQINNC